MEIDVEQLEIFLRRVDESFPTPLSQRQEPHAYACKLKEKATICARLEKGQLLSAVMGYTDAVTDGLAYISVVATLAEARGRGYASELLCDFITICKKKGLRGVHLYTARCNAGAIALYERLGFRRLQLQDEPRPEDVHFCLLFDKKETL